MERLAERQAQNAAEELARPVQPAKTEPTITKQHAMTAPAQPDEAHWERWRNFIKSTMKPTMKHMDDAIIGAVGDVLGDVTKKINTEISEFRDKVGMLANETASLRDQLAALKAEVAELRAEGKVRGSLDEVQARLAKLETPPRLKAAG